MTNQNIFYETFFPNAFREFSRARSEKVRFVHYTSAEAAFKIINSEKAWMRKSSTMNDLSEINHGFSIVEKALVMHLDLPSALNEISAGLYDEVLSSYRDCKGPLLDETYVFSLSEHNLSEDILGRLSMWRAYGRGNGVALILNNTPFVGEDDTLGVFTSPVIYGDLNRANIELSTIVANIKSNISHLRSIDKKLLKNGILMALCFGATSLKHPGSRVSIMTEEYYNTAYKEINKK